MGNKDVKAAPFLAEIMKPSGVTKYYTKEELLRLKPDFYFDPLTLVRFEVGIS